MQLWEQGLIDLDAPANDYLRSSQVAPAKPTWRPATARRLLTHTAGIPEVVQVSDPLRPSWGPFGSFRPNPACGLGADASLAVYYLGGPGIVAEPGYRVHVHQPWVRDARPDVADVSGWALHQYLREHIFEPLGMNDTELLPS